MNPSSLKEPRSGLTVVGSSAIPITKIGASSTAATTTYTATTIVDGTAWSLSAITAGEIANGVWAVTADGFRGRVTAVNDATDTVTVSGWINPAGHVLDPLIMTQKPTDANACTLHRVSYCKTLVVTGYAGNANTIYCGYNSSLPSDGTDGDEINANVTKPYIGNLIDATKLYVICAAGSPKISWVASDIVGGIGAGSSAGSSGAVDLTADVTGVLPMANGGSGKALTASANKLVYSDSDSFELLATGNSSVLVTNGSGVPSLATDIPTAVTIGSSYIYRVGGTDVAMADGGAPATRVIELDTYRPYADGGSNSGILADYHDNTNHRNYTRWSSALTTQDYDLVFKFKIPTDFSSFPSGAFSIDVRSNDYTGNVMTASMYDGAGSVDAGINGASIAPTANNVWETKTDTPTATYNIGDWVHIHIHLGNDEASNTCDVARLFLTYNTR